MFGSIPDWDFFLGQAYRCTRPGGWIEIVEHSVEPIADDDTQPPGHFYYAWGKTVVEMGERNGKSFTIWEEAKERLERAGFVDVVEVKYTWPINGWHPDPRLKEIGRWNQLRLHSGIEGFMLRLLTMVGNVSRFAAEAYKMPNFRNTDFLDVQWSYERSQLFLAEMRRSIRDYSCHAVLPG
jgi:hypothetical protein